MNPFGIVFVGAGALLLRQVIVGRAEETPGDLRDLTNALLSGDATAIREVSSRRGSNVDAGAVVVADALASTPGPIPNNIGTDTGSNLINEVIRLGGAAKGYMWGATGPKYFDCSGLVWRAMHNLGLYKGARFTTSSFHSTVAKSGIMFQQVPPTLPSQISRDFGFEDFVAPGDIILWPGQHIGVCRSGTIMYSARSPSKGIGESDFISDAEYFGSWPEIWQIGTP